MHPNDPKLRRWGLIVAVAFAALALVDFVALRGEVVGRGSVSLRPDSQPFVVEVARPGETYLLKITTRWRKRGESQGRSIAYRLVGPHGSTVAEDSEIIDRKTRYVSFTPTQSGAYTLYAEETALLGGGRGTAQVTVSVNDRRVISRLLGF